MRGRSKKPGASQHTTDRKQLEERLRASEQIFYELFDAIPEPISISKLGDGSFIYVNQSFLEATSYKRGELLGQSALGLKFWSVVDDCNRFLEALQRGPVRNWEVTFLTKSGEKRTGLASAKLIEIGNQPCFTTFMNDITERKRAEEELSQSRQTLQSILDTIPQRVFWKDRNSSYLGCNKAFATDAGLKDPVEIIGKTDFELAWTETAELYRADDKLVMEHATPRLNFEEPQSRPDGSLLWLRTSKLPLRDREGEVVGVIGTYEDITERKQAEAEKASLVTAIEQSAEGVLITTTAGEIEYVNPAFTRITGYSREEVLGLNPRILNSGEQTAAFFERLWATILKGEIWHGEIVNRRKDGELYIEEMNIAPVRGAHGEITHFIATKQDVTERKHLENQFRQAQKMEAVGRLAGGVAHDFNNLLTIINGYIDLLLESLAAEDPKRDYLAEIRKAGERAGTLTRQLLAFSRRQVLVPQILNLNDVVASAEKMLRRLIGEDIDLVTRLDPALAKVKADSGQIEQVILNLAVNARDAMPRGGRLTIETANVQLDEAYARSHGAVSTGAYVMLAASDTGIGMDAETQAQIFEPFFPTKEPGKGSGLGLATVYGIVKQSSGNIWVYSEPGKGATFKVYLPRVDAPAEEVRAGNAPAVAVGGTETILVVEDEEAVRELVVKALEGYGYKLLRSKSVEDAVHIAEQQKEPIDLLLTDVVMPGMSGREIAQHLAFANPKMKVLYMSGYTDDAIVHHGVLESGVAFLQKPFTPEALARKVREVLDLGRKEG